MKLFPDSDSKSNTIKDLKRFGIALVAALLIFAVGSTESAFIIPVTALVGFSAGYFTAKAVKGTATIKDGLMWGTVGLAAGILFYLAI